MAGTRERALDAAVDVLGTDGVRALSHARVDTAAGLPAGSTSNWFRTRRALLAGVVDWIAEGERADFGASDFPVAPGDTGLVDGLCTLIELLTGRYAVRTRARYALFLELSSDAELGPVLRGQRREFERWTEQLVSAAGIPDAPSATRALMALCDGLILHRITVDPELAVRPLIERTVRALKPQL
ncbi:TetR family transcriptional regulator [Leifsonia sp. NPDC077715]|uniref:TetR/AcrR family transcriptional regulator n=1 Tax=Leifsonia sp. NPDC077715 TaxID=3155539 RepID=UPI00343D1CA2